MLFIISSIVYVLGIVLHNPIEKPDVCRVWSGVGRLLPQKRRLVLSAHERHHGVQFAVKIVSVGILLAVVLV